MIPAHKQTDKDKLPGQIVNQIPNNWPNKSMGQIVNDVTLSDYYARKMKEKMSFDEWWSRYAPSHFSLDDADSLRVLFNVCWNTSRENM